MEKKDQEAKNLIAKDAMNAINELEESVKLENLIKDNMIEFQCDTKKYRVRKPSHTELEDVNRFRRKAYIKLVQDDSYLFKKQWIETYKTKGIDILKMDTQVKSMNSEIQQLLLRLAKANVPTDIDKLKKEILALRAKQYIISMEKTDLMAFSVEDALLLAVNSYTTYKVLEYQDGDKWLRVHHAFEDFEASENGALLNKACFYLSHLIYNGEKND